MTAADNLGEAADLARQAAEYESLTTHHTLAGLVFNAAQPLPPLRDHRARREWETETKAKEPSEWPLTNTAETTLT